MMPKLQVPSAGNRARRYVGIVACVALVTWGAAVFAQGPPRSDAYESFRLAHRRAAEAAEMLDRELAGRARTVVDGRGNRVYVRGGDQAKRNAAELIADFDQPRERVDREVAAASVAQAAPAGPERSMAIDWPAKQIGPRLVHLFGQRLKRQSANEAGAVYVVAGNTGKSVYVRSLPLEGKLAFAGPEPLTSQAMRLVAAHDGSGTGAQSTVRTISLVHADAAQAEQAAQLYRRGNPPAGGGDGPQARLAQAGQPAPPAEVPAEGDDPVDPNERLRELGLDLDIEVLPDLDAIILRGSNRDVNEVLRIIEDIERISAETVPEVEVVNLKHVSSQALVPLLQQIQQDLLMGRPGRVTIAALNKPNAVLLVGWGESIKSVRELISKLDQPVPPQTQLRVFRLRHAAAATAATTIEQFYSQREGLGTRLLVTPDIRSNSLIVQAAPRDMAEIEVLIQRIDTEKNASVNLVRVFKLRNSLATNLAETLTEAIESRAAGQGGNDAKSSVLELLTVDPQGQKVIKSGILSDVKITPDPRANSLIVTAPAQSMALVAALIAQMDDSAASVSQIKVFNVVNGDASSLVEMLRALLPQGGNAPGTTLSRADGDSSLAPLRYSVDTRTNSIIAAGSAGDLEIIEAMLLRLDESDVEKRKNTVYQLKNAPALDVAEAINIFLRSERQVLEAVPGEISPFQEIEKEVVVVPEPVGNLLIISASPRYYDEILRIVEEIDSAPPQVLIQVLIAEVTLNDTTEFGVEWGVQDGLLFDRSLLGDLLTTTTSTTFGNPPTTVQQQNVISATQDPGYQFNGPDIGNSGSDRSLATAAQVGKQALANFAVGRTNEELGFGGLVLSAGSKSINVLLRALQQEQRLEVLSRPQVMTIDNQPAFVQVGQKVPLITNVIVNQIGQTNTVDYDNVGLILAVTPRISPEGMVVMEVDAEKSAVAPEIEGIPVSIGADGSVVRAPRIDITTAQTTVSAADGETIVLGGLITESERRLDRRVPYLASIPVLGWMFRFDQLIADRTELLIILTPHVVRNPSEADRLRQIEAARMSWCAADVHALHGDPAFCRRGECPACNANMPVFYPDLDPAGMSPVPMEGMEIIDSPAPGEPTMELPEPGVSAEKDRGGKWNFMKLFSRREPEKATAQNDSKRLPPAGPTPAGVTSVAAGPTLRTP